MSGEGKRVGCLSVPITRLPRLYCLVRVAPLMGDISRRYEDVRIHFYGQLMR
jgi:hypothetical protein